MESVKTVLLNTKLFHNLSSDELDVLLETQHVTVSHYEKNSFITYAGDKIEGIGLVLKGHVLITKENVLGDAFSRLPRRDDIVVTEGKTSSVSTIEDSLFSSLTDNKKLFDCLLNLPTQRQ